MNILVARELARRRDAWQGSLIFSSVTDEEAYSEGARTLIARGINADACFVTESGFTTAIVGAPGKSWCASALLAKPRTAFIPGMASTRQSSWRALWRRSATRCRRACIRACHHRRRMLLIPWWQHAVCDHPARARRGAAHAPDRAW